MSTMELSEALATDEGLRLFRWSWLSRQKFKQLSLMMGPLEGMACLELGGGGGPLSLCLRKLGGSWNSADLPEFGGGKKGPLTGVNVVAVKENQLDFEESRFDLVIIFERLEMIEEDHVFVAECHRILKDNGRLVVLAPHLKKSFIRPLRSFLGMSDVREGQPREGYTQARLFKVVKDGFNIEEARTFSRFFVELLHTLISLIVSRWSKEDGSEGSPEVVEEKIYKVLVTTYSLYWLASKLDLLLLFTRGYSLAISARSKIWSRRRAPVLQDGRSIADAAINTKIGTAAPF